MGAKHYTDRKEAARIDALVMSAFDAGGNVSKEEIIQRIGRRRITAQEVSAGLMRLSRAGKLTHTRKDGWSVVPAP